MRRIQFLHNLLLAFSFLEICSVALAQDIHFSQFFTNPLSLNPAETALYDGNVRVNALYRTQWLAIDNKAYQTISISGEKQFHLYDHTFGFGIQALRDESGYVGLIQDKILISGALNLHVNGHQLSGGVQLGLVYKTTNLLSYTYDSQFDLGGNEVFNREFTSGESEGKTLFHPAIHAGFSWNKRLTHNYIAQIGVSVFNLNTPYESLSGIDLDNSKQDMRFCLQSGGTIEINKKNSIKPHILYMRQDKATDFILGGTLEHAVNKNMTVIGGTLFRYGWEKNYDASIWMVGAKYKRCLFSVSYDINVSSLRKATNLRGALEASFTYLSPSWKSSKITIPCERI